MAESNDRVPAEEPVDLRDRARPVPATPPVIEVTPAETPDPDPTPAADIRPIDSSLVGEGGLPPASREEAEAPRHVAADAASPDAAEAPVVADAPDPGPMPGTSAAPPRIVPAASAPPARRGGFWPLVLGGVVAAALGSAATIWALPRLSEGMRPAADAPAAPPAPAVDAAALEAAAASAAQAEVAAQRDTLLASARDAGAEGARAALAEAPAAADDAALAQLQERVAALEELAGRVEALEAQPAAAAPAAEDGTAPEAAGIAALREELAAQAARLEELAARPQPDPAALEELRTLAASAQSTEQQIEAAAAAAEQRLAAAESGAAAVEERVAEAARRTEALAAVSTLESALVAGGDRAAAVEGLASAGVEAPPALAAPAPSLEELQESFPEAARAGLRASLREAPAGNTLTNFLRAQTGARSVEPRPGGDPDAVLSRAGDAVARGEIGAALTELDALPAAGREAMADWLRGAEAWAAAAEALGQVQGNLK